MAAGHGDVAAEQVLAGFQGLGLAALPPRPGMPSDPAPVGHVAGSPLGPCGLGAPSDAGDLTAATVPCAAACALANLQPLTPGVFPGVPPGLSGRPPGPAAALAMMEHLIKMGSPHDVAQPRPPVPLALHQMLRNLSPQALAALPQLLRPPGPQQRETFCTPDPNAVVLPKVREFCDEFEIGQEKLVRLLDQQIKLRANTADEDLDTLREILKNTRAPPGLLMVKIKEMQEGTFIGSPKNDKDIDELSKTFKLDAQATTKLADVILKCSKDKQRDLKEIRSHLEVSNKPSAVVMMLLGKLRRGEGIGECKHEAAPGSWKWEQMVRSSRKDAGRDRERGRDVRDRRDHDRDRARPRGRDRERRSRSKSRSRKRSGRRSDRRSRSRSRSRSRRPRSRSRGGSRSRSRSRRRSRSPRSRSRRPTRRAGGKRSPSRSEGRTRSRSRSRRRSRSPRSRSRGSPNQC